VTLLEGRLRFVEAQLAAGDGPPAGARAVVPRLTSAGRSGAAAAAQPALARLQGPTGLLDALMAPGYEPAAGAPLRSPPLDPYWGGGRGGAFDGSGGVLPAALPSWQRTSRPAVGGPAAALRGSGGWSPPAPWDATADGGGLLAAAAARPCDAEALGGASSPRPGAAAGAVAGGGGGPAAFKGGGGTEGLVEKLALRHAQAQALLKKMQEARARRL
jgi:hypothetical protein